MSLLGFEVSAITVALMVLLALLGLFAAMALFARNYIKVPPSEVAIFYGRKHTLTDEKGNRSTVGFRVVRGGAALRVPVLEKVAYLSLNIISIPLRIQRAYTKEGVPVTVEAVANVKIAGDDMSLRGASERFLGMNTDEIKGVIFQTLEGHLRAILGTLTVEEINADRQAFAQKMTDEAAQDLKKMGVNIDIPPSSRSATSRGTSTLWARSARRRSSATPSSARRWPSAMPPSSRPWPIRKARPSATRPTWPSRSHCVTRRRGRRSSMPR
jgi:hypothetical protein